MSLAKEFPIGELPRERLMRDGIEALSLQELVAILLGTGTRGKSVLILAQELLLQFGGMEGLLTTSIEELTKVKGVGQAKAILLKAAFGIALRASREKIAPRRLILSVEDALAIARPAIGHLKKEALLVILRDIKCRHIHHEIVSIGTLTEVLVHPREVFALAIKHSAHSMILCHNHPSGDPTPSKADLDLTRQLLKSAQVMGISIADHLILGKKNDISLKNSHHMQ